MLSKHANISAEYTDNLTPQERKLFWTYFETEQRDIKQREDAAANGEQYFTPLSPDLPNTMMPR